MLVELLGGLLSLGGIIDLKNRKFEKKNQKPNQIKKFRTPDLCRSLDNKIFSLNFLEKMFKKDYRKNSSNSNNTGTGIFYIKTHFTYIAQLSVSFSEI